MVPLPLSDANHVEDSDHHQGTLDTHSYEGMLGQAVVPADGRS